MSEKKATRAAKPTRAPKPHATDDPLVVVPPMIELEAKITIVHAAALHRALTASLAQGHPIVLDGSRVEEIDTAILQLLTSLWLTCLERGFTCTWHGVSDALRRTAVLIGVDQDLCLPALEPA